MKSEFRATMMLSSDLMPANPNREATREPVAADVIVLVTSDL
jgi:hypothetical protein